MRGFFGLDLREYKHLLDGVYVPSFDGMRRTENYHTTLTFYPSISENAAMHVAGMIEANPFTLRADRVVSSPNPLNPNAFALCFDEESESRVREIRSSMVPGFPPKKDKFIPHITMTGKPGIGSGFHGEVYHVRGIDPIEMEVNEVSFMKSVPSGEFHAYKNLFVKKLGE